MIWHELWIWRLPIAILHKAIKYSYKINLAYDSFLNTVTKYQEQYSKSTPDFFKRSLTVIVNRRTSFDKRSRFSFVYKTPTLTSMLIKKKNNLWTVGVICVFLLHCRIKSLHSQLSEKSARIRFLQNNNEHDEGDDEPSEPEWPLDPAFCRTDFAHTKDLARDSCKYLTILFLCGAGEGKDEMILLKCSNIVKYFFRCWITRFRNVTY